MTDVMIPTPQGQMAVEVVAPDGEGPWPGVVVVHDALGMTTDLRNQARWLASEGFVAVAPDLYHYGSRMRCLVSTLRAFTAGEGRAFEDIEAARQWLVARDDCTGRVGIIGFCMGGGFALALATGDYLASSVNYGVVDPSDVDLAGACPVVASYGGRDRSLTQTPEQLETVLTELGVEHDIEVYPDAGHGFLNDHARAEMPVWARIAGAWSRTAYHEPSAVAARERIVRFFDTHLR